MTVRAIFSEWTSPFFLDVARRLESEHGWRPVYWIADERAKRAVKQAYPEIVFHRNLDAIRGIPAAELHDLKLPALGDDLLKELAHHESITLEMMNRMDPGEAFGYEDRVRLYHTLLRYWSAVLDTCKPNAVVFPTSPHVVYDYVLYMLARRRGIRCFHLR